MADNRAEHPTASSFLLAGAKQMDAESWSRLVSTFGPVVYGWARASGVKESEASDVVQDVFISVARGIASFERQKKEGSFRSWLATITRSRVRDHFRRQTKQNADGVGGTAAWESIQQTPEATDDFDSTICPDSALGIIRRSALESVKAEFEPPTWKAFWMMAVEEMPGKEVAENLGMSLASVYQSKSRVLRRLRQRLADLPS